MSKYRRGIAYLRALKPTDKANDFRTALRIATFSDRSVWKRPDHVKPVVLVQYGVKGVAAVFMNEDEALRSMMVKGKTRRNARHNRKRGLRTTKADYRNAWRKLRFDDARPSHEK